jgi:hypothetical protein
LSEKHFMRLLLLIFIFVAYSQAAIVPQWTGFSLATEAGIFLDNDPEMFKDAESITKSFYFLNGKTGYYSMVVAVNDQRVTQELWKHRTIRRMASLDLRVSNNLICKFSGFYNSASKNTGGWGVHSGVDVIHDSVHSFGSLFGRHYSSLQDMDADLYSTHHVFLNYADLHGVRRMGRYSLGLNLIGTQEENKSGVAVLCRLEGGSVIGLSWRLSALKGKINNWFDTTRMVLHDSPQALRNMLEGGVRWRAANNIEVNFSAGWEKLQEYENSWLAVVIGYNHVQWFMSK